MTDAPKTIWATETLAKQNSKPHTNVYREVARQYTLTASVEAQLKAADELAEAVNRVGSRPVSPVTGGRLILEADILSMIEALTAYHKAKTPIPE